MAFRFNGIECDTASEAVELMSLGGTAERKPTVGRKKRVGKPNLAVKRRWAKVRAISKKEGISIREASEKLKKESK